MLKHRTVRDLAIVVGVAILVRVLYLAVFGGFDNDLHDSMTDQLIYLDIAGNLADGEGFVVSGEIWTAVPGEPTSIMPPLYPVVLGALFTFTGDSVLAARILGLILAAALVALVYLIAARIVNRRGALLAGLVAALYPPLVMYVRPVMSEALFFPLVALLVYLTLRMLEDRPSRLLWPAWGVVAGLAVLTRTEVGLLTVLLMLFVLGYHWFRGRRLLLAPVLVAVAGFVLILSPYALYNYQSHGSPIPLPNAKWKMWDHTWWADARTQPEWQGVTLPERQVVPDWYGKTERERDAYLWGMTVDFVRDNPQTYVKQRIKRVVGSYPLIPLEELRQVRPPDGAALGPTSLDDSVRYSTAAEKLRVWSFRLAFLGAAAGLAYGLRRKEILLLGVVVAWNVLHSALFVGSERLRMQIDVFLIVLTASAIIAVWSTVRSRRSQQEYWDSTSAAVPPV